MDGRGRADRRSTLEESADEACRARYRLDARLEEHARRAEWLVGHGYLVPPASDVRLRRTPDLVDPVAVAAAARQVAGCPSGPLGAPADVLERFGLYPTAVDEAAEGASLLLKGYGVAVISGQVAPGRRRWTAAHELGHHLMQDEYHSDAGVVAGRDEGERLIGRFVEEFLLPEADVRRVWSDGERDGQAPRTTMIALSASYRMSWSAVVNRTRSMSPRRLPGSLLVWDTSPLLHAIKAGISRLWATSPGTIRAVPVETSRPRRWSARSATSVCHWPEQSGWRSSTSTT
nr:ImmA/IrrE family metallo-endopeptidase [Streptomyces sp. SID3915]